MGTVGCTCIASLGEMPTERGKTKQVHLPTQLEMCQVRRSSICHMPMQGEPVMQKTGDADAQVQLPTQLDKCPMCGSELEHDRYTRARCRGLPEFNAGHILFLHMHCITQEDGRPYSGNDGVCYVRPNSIPIWWWSG